MQKTVFLYMVLYLLELSLNGQELEYSDSLIVGEIIIEGNNVTKRKIVLRELAFKTDNYIYRSEIEYLRQTSINNLNKTSLFNFIEVYANEKQPGILFITVILTERWYIWPTLYLNHTDRNFSEWWRTKDLNKLEYGFGFKVSNFRGMKESVLVNYRLGNFTKYELEYRGIHLDKSDRHLMSFKTSYSSNNYVPWDIESNRFVYLKSSYKLFYETYFLLKYQYRKVFFNTHSIGLGFSDLRIADTVLSLNPDYFAFQNQQQRYLSIEYEFVRDTRDSKVYPKTGYYLLGSIKKNGLGILPGEFNSTDIRIQLFGYRQLSKKFYAASGISVTSNSNDYRDFYSQTGLGYMQFVRGYEYYVVNGDNAYLFKSFLKFELLPKQVINLKVWPIRKAYQINRIPFEVYTNVFFDAGYVNDKYDTYKLHNNTLVNKLMYSIGLGMDFVTYYDKIFRIDYSYNALGESGLYVHWKAAIR